MANAVPKVASKPITSPVDFISGPRIESTWSPAGVRNRANGSTASLTAIGRVGREITAVARRSAARPSSRSSSIVAPSAMRAAALASCTAVAFDTNGTVRRARGFASRT